MKFMWGLVWPLQNVLSSSGQYSSLLLLQVSLLPVHSTTSCPLSTTDFFGISPEKNSFKSNSYFIRQSATIWRTKRLLVIAKVRRTQRACALYCNSTLTFRPLLKLIFDIEHNPGPNGSFYCSVKANTRNINNQLQDVGASTSVLQWFNSYLTNIYQIVLIHSTVSNPIPIEYGVPQGSILGPLLFSIIIR